jgi:hypothetical protein
VLEVYERLARRDADVDQHRVAGPQRGHGVVGGPEPQVGGEVVKRAGRNHQQRQAGFQRDRRRGTDRAVAAGHSEYPCSLRGLAQLCRQVLGSVCLDDRGLGKFGRQPIGQLRRRRSR